MDWKEYIVSDKNVLLGKPTIKGTRISVEFVIQLLASGWSEVQILENYPRLKANHLQAVFSYVYDSIHDNLVYNFSPETA
jgi:uncharacterized protein (DUF433 family)